MGINPEKIKITPKEEKVMTEKALKKSAIDSADKEAVKEHFLQQRDLKELSELWQKDFEELTEQEKEILRNNIIIEFGLKDLLAEYEEKIENFSDYKNDVLNQLIKKIKRFKELEKQGKLSVDPNSQIKQFAEELFKMKKAA